MKKMERKVLWLARRCWFTVFCVCVSVCVGNIWVLKSATLLFDFFYFNFLFSKFNWINQIRWVGQPAMFPGSIRNENKSKSKANKQEQFKSIFIGVEIVFFLFFVVIFCPIKYNRPKQSNIFSFSFQEFSFWHHQN